MNATHLVRVSAVQSPSYTAGNEARCEDWSKMVLLVERGIVQAAVERSGQHSVRDVGCVSYHRRRAPGDARYRC